MCWPLALDVHIVLGYIVRTNIIYTYESDCAGQRLRLQSATTRSDSVRVVTQCRLQQDTQMNDTREQQQQQHWLLRYALRNVYRCIHYSAIQLYCHFVIGFHKTDGIGENTWNIKYK